MEYLAANHNVLSLEEAVQRMKAHDVPDNAVVITFDDGYKDNFLNAFPVLKRLGLPATVFVATDAVSSGRQLWHDRVFSAFRETRVERLKAWGDSPTDYWLRTVDQKVEAQGHVLRHLRSLSDAERLIWVERLIGELKVADRGDENLMLTWDDLAIMHRDRVSIGSHSATHPVLSKISVERTREEIVGSKATLEAKLGVSVTTFAYPNGAKGDYDDRTKQALKEAGYACAVTTTFGTNECDHDPFELRRGTPWETDLPAFALKLNWYRFQSGS
jgi:peptidoglycan/xylan/chitin deacetylase (PgdA/CDA1 family)